MCNMNWRGCNNIPATIMEIIMSRTIRRLTSGRSCKYNGPNLYSWKACGYLTKEMEFEYTRKNGSCKRHRINGVKKTKRIYIHKDRAKSRTDIHKLLSDMSAIIGTQVSVDE